MGQPVYLRPGTISLDSALAIISKQTGVVFSYNSKRVNNKQYIKLPQVSTLSDFIEFLKEDKQVTVKMIENYIVLSGSIFSEKPPAKKTNPDLNSKRIERIDQPKSVKVNPEPGSKDQAVDTVLVRSMTDTLTLDKPGIRVRLDSAVAQGLSDTVRVIEKQMIVDQPLVKVANDTILSSTAVPSALAKQDSVRPLRSKRDIDSRSDRKPFIKPGLTGDESSFMGAICQVGLPVFYGSVSVNTNLKATHVRYGAGASIKLNSGPRLHFMASYGNVNRSGRFTDFYGDPYPIDVRSRSIRVGAGLEFYVQNRFSVQAIPTFNRLTTQYFIDNEPSDLGIFDDRGDELFYAIKPPYTIMDTFSPDTNSNTKTWIGLQVNVLYRINIFNQ